MELYILSTCFLSKYLSEREGFPYPSLERPRRFGEISWASCRGNLDTES